MRIHRHRRFQREIRREQTMIRANDRIHVPEVLVIDEQGENIGAMPTAQAIALAKERGLDLIEVNPAAQPPVCKFLNLKQHKYEQEKAQRAQKAHAKRVEVKGVRLSLRIGEHDRDHRRTQAQKFLDDGNRIAVEIILRGRERAYRDQARQIILAFVDDLKREYDITVDQPLSVQGGRHALVVGGRRKETTTQASQSVNQ